MNLNENLEKLKPRYTEVNQCETPESITLILKRPHPFITKPQILVNSDGTEIRFTPKEYLRFEIKKDSQEITNTITEEQKDIIYRILQNPESYEIEFLIDKLYEIQRNYQMNSNTPEVNLLGAISATLLSLGIQEDFIKQAFENNHTTEQIIIIVFHFLLLQSSFKTIRSLSQYIYKFIENYKYKNLKDSNQ